MGFRISGVVIQDGQHAVHWQPVERAGPGGKSPLPDEVHPLFEIA